MNPKNMETSTFSLRDEIEKVKALPKEQRFDYIWTYYKTTLFIGGAVLAVTWMVISFAVSAFMGTFFPEDPISVAVVAQTWDGSGLDSWVEDCKEAIGYDDKQEELSVLTSTGPSEYNNTFVINCTCWLAAGQPDVFICNQATLDYLLEKEVLADLAPLLSLEEETCWLDISGCGFAETAGVAEEPLYLCMYQNGSGLTRAVDIVRYILAE